jgi:hypothetical protein
VTVSLTPLTLNGGDRVPPEVVCPLCIQKLT